MKAGCSSEGSALSAMLLRLPVASGEMGQPDGPVAAL